MAGEPFRRRAWESEHTVNGAFDLPDRQHMAGGFESDMEEDPMPGASRSDPGINTAARPEPRIKREYLPRQCRICLEIVLPSFDRDGINTPSMLHPTPRVSYISEDPASGRLMRPCLCRGSQQYVHEGCLQAWRYSNAAASHQNMWQCPTCRFKYRLERLRVARILSNTATEVALTLAIMLAAVFFFGFIADPIIDLYLDPINTITSIPTGRKLKYMFDNEPEATWTEHWLKGLASLGLMGFVKVVFTMPWWNIRGGTLGGVGRGRALGRNRLENISWAIVVTGIITFLYLVWKWVRAWCRRSLEAAGEHVADVQGSEDEDEQ